MELEEGRWEEVEVSGGANGCWAFLININVSSTAATITNTTTNAAAA